MSEAVVEDLLSKFGHHDPDNRIMALSDMSAHLTANQTIVSEGLQRRMLEAILKRLEVDTNESCKSIAVKCLTDAVKVVSPSEVAFACQKLATHLATGDSQLSDVFSTGLQQVVSTCHEQIADATPIIVTVASGLDKAAPKLPHCINVTCSVLHYCAQKVDESQLLTLSNSLVALLTVSNDAVQSAAIKCLGYLSAVLPEASLESLVSRFKADLSKSGDACALQAIAAVASKVGFRLSKHVKDFLPLLLACLAAVTGNDDADNTLRESCVNAIQAFVIACPPEMAPFVDQIIAACKPLVQYDPNFDYSASMPTSGSDSEDEYSDYDDYAVSDDEDSSWKTRRSALQCLAAVIKTRPESLRKLYSELGALLVDRFKEREQSVLLDVLACFTSLLEATGHSQVAVASPEDDSAMPAPVSLVRQRSSVSQLQELMPSVVAASCGTLSSSSSVKTTLAIWQVLQSLELVSGASFVGAADQVIPLAITSIDGDGEDVQLQLEPLLLVQHMVVHNPDYDFVARFNALVPCITAASGSDWYRLAAEALTTLGHLALGNAPLSSSVVSSATEAVCSQLRVDDADKSVKCAAVFAAGAILANRSSSVRSDVANSVLTLLMERTNNETTRLAAFQALHRVANGSCTVSLTAVASALIKEVGGFLTLVAASDRLAAAQALLALIQNGSTVLAGPTAELALASVTPSISAEESRMCATVLSIISQLLSQYPALEKSFTDNTFPLVVEALSSEMLQGSAVDALVTVLVTYGGLVPPMRVLDTLAAPAATKRARANKAICVASVCAILSKAQRAQVVTNMVDALVVDSEQAICQSLANLGQLGARRALVASDRSVLGAVQKVLASPPSANVLQAATVAFGGLVFGSPEQGVDTLLELFQGASLLNALASTAALLHFANEEGSFSQSDRLLPVLVSNIGVADEHASLLIARCLGQLASLNVEPVYTALEAVLCSEVPEQRATAVRAIMYALKGPGSMVTIAGHLSTLVRSLDDPAVCVRAAAVELVRVAATVCPTAIGNCVSTQESKGEESTFTKVLREGEPKKEHKRTVNMGSGFKVNFDDGLELRKNVYACVEAIVAHLPAKINMAAVLRLLEGGISDNEEIQALALGLLRKLSSSDGFSVHVLSSLAQISDAMHAVSTKLLKRKKKDMLNQVKALVKTVCVLHQLPGSLSVEAFSSLYTLICDHPVSKPMLDGTDGAQAAAGAGAGAGAGSQ